jgi:2-isopropylmalate synthase
MLKNNETYEIMTPESVGLSESTLVMGKHSGRHAFKEKAFELGYALADNQLNDAFYRFKDLADKKKEVFDDDIIAIIDDEFSSSIDHIKLVSLKIQAGTSGPQIADLVLNINNQEKSTICEGSGPVDAIFNSIRNLFPHKADLQLYQVHAVTQGTDAQAEVSVRLHEDGKTVVGRGADTDTLVASARAYIGALNRLIIKREKANPDFIET